MSESGIDFKPNGFRVYSSSHVDQIGTIYWDEEYRVWGFIPEAVQPELHEEELEAILNKLKEMNNEN